MPDVAGLGAKMGPRLAQLMSAGAVDVYRKTADTRARIGTQAAANLFRDMSGKLHRTIGPLFAELSEDEELPLWLRDTLRFMASERGEVQAMMGTITAAASMTPGVGQVISNALAPKIQTIIARNPHALLPAGALADLAARHLLDLGTARLDAARQGLSSRRFGFAVEGARAYPDLGTLNALEDRGVINRNTAMTALARQGYSRLWQQAIPQLFRQLLSPEILAQMVVRGVVSSSIGRSIARKSGLSAADFDRLVRVTGRPPGLQELLFAFRRGLINRARLHHGIRQSDVKNEWIDVIEALRFAPMPPEAAINAAVQGHISASKARRIVSEGGIRPQDFEPLLETAGNPPGIGQMLDLWKRGEISRERVTQAIRESRIKNKYIPDLLRIGRVIPPMRTVTSMVRNGVISEREGIRKLMEIGFNREDAGNLAANASQDKTAPDRQLAKSDVLTLFRENAISEPTARSFLEAVGYSAQEVSFLLSIEGLRRARRDRDHAIARTRASFVAHRISVNETSATLDRLGVPAPERDRLLGLWDLERLTNTRELTPAQVIGAAVRGFITEPEALTRLAQMGYDPGDASLLFRIATTPKPKVAPSA